MDLIWTIGLLVVGYFGYNWYTGLQQQVRGSDEPEDRVTGPDAPPVADNSTPSTSSDTDYIDYEELDD